MARVASSDDRFPYFSEGGIGSATESRASGDQPDDLATFAGVGDHAAA
ncbi:MAG: hypothetical protein OXL96_11805 [Candidatus Poribacteria bacterium]|nr:hypothetical protein [Candidatus Poribacteria bacterium]